MKYLVDVYVEVEGDSPEEALQRFHLGDWSDRVDIVGVDEIRPRLIVVGQPKLREMES